MSILEIFAIIALTGWAVYRQTIAAPVLFSVGRFKTSVIYVGVGLAVGGFDLPTGWAGWALIIAGLALSYIVGVARGRLTRLRTTDDTVWQQGTALTVGLFLGLIAVKFCLGTLAWFWHIDDGAGFGETLLMIAIMIAVQAQIVHQRSRTLTAPLATGSAALQPSPH